MRLEFEIAEFNALAKPPKFIEYIGNTELLMRRKVSIVGTRHPNSYTKSTVYALSSRLASNGFVVVSGAALGVDAIAHEGAGAENTIAVVANGLDIRYPATNANLIKSIEAKGLMLSQFESLAKAFKYSFVLRNELVSALGEVVIIAEADLESGSLTTAKFAIKQNKPLFVLPHRLGESLGTHELVKQKLAQPIYDIDEFLSSLGVATKDQELQDELLEFCATSPLYDAVFEKFGHKVFEYELFGKIKIDNGRCIRIN